MKWSAHLYLTSSNDGLMKRLDPTKEDLAFLETLKKIIRTRTKDVFEEAKEVIKMLSKRPHGSNNLLFVENAVRETFLRYLDQEDIQQLAKLLINMSDDAREAFLSTEPRFWVQGSYNYKTLNKPYHLPPQQMDIDDGTYMPMEMFKEQPLVGHRLLLLLVDASLASLEKENIGWKASKMLNCGRITLKDRDVHIDVPMYAIPKEQFVAREIAEARMTMDSMDAITANESYLSKSAKVRLEEDCVYLAVRGNDKWIKSDPETVARWFRKAVDRHKEPMRQICRYLKAWRDVQWEHPDLSSITLMKCVVDTFDKIKMPNSLDHGELLLAVTERLSAQLTEGVESPDASDDGRLLFPKKNMDKATSQKIISRAEELHSTLRSALKDSPTKKQTLQLLNVLFGDGVVNEEIIKPWASMPAYQQPRQPQPKSQMKDSMTSG
ncbi:CBASS cGAMP synthase [Pantoea stewartii]|uniref:CBASS cGAMP synthase n=1 Tax=Pantoea stewartii TaxID=66269 RepID=UPI0021D4AAE2|nr:CBASS cGAMP synthase [Pantoea stewartii]MCU7368978.1 CBASS cGAMP synthase [Pantoea stewartii]